MILLRIILCCRAAALVVLDPLLSAALLACFVLHDFLNWFLVHCFEMCLLFVCFEIAYLSGGWWIVQAMQGLWRVQVPPQPHVVQVLLSCSCQQHRSQVVIQMQVVG